MIEIVLIIAIIYMLIMTWKLYQLNNRMEEKVKQLVDYKRV